MPQFLSAEAQSLLRKLFKRTATARLGVCPSLAVLCCAVLCCVVLCCAVLCCAVLCCAVLCCVVLCCAVCVYLSVVCVYLSVCFV